MGKRCVKDGCVIGIRKLVSRNRDRCLEEDRMASGSGEGRWTLLKDGKCGEV